MTPAEKIIAIETCRDLVVRSVRSIDNGDLDSMAALFTIDSELVRPSGSAKGRDAVKASYASRPADRISRHIVTNSIIDITSDKTAHGTCTILVWAGSTKDEAGPFGRRAEPSQKLAEFEDDFALTDEGWRISKRQSRFILYRD